MNSRTLLLADMHCHVDLYRDFRSIVDEIVDRDIFTIGMTNAPSVFLKCAEILALAPSAHPALGLHPELIESRQSELPLLIELAERTKFIGEVGLDYTTRDPKIRAAQRKVFSTILELCAATGDKVLSIHSRGAAGDVVDMIGRQFPGVVILHWYSGPVGVLEKAIANGYYFSVNPAMCRSQSGARVIERIPRDRLLTESDGPFVSFRRAPARPSDVVAVLDFVAGLWDATPSSVAQRVHENLKNAAVIV